MTGERLAAITFDNRPGAIVVGDYAIRPGGDSRG
jgi:hypothetical protein